MSQKRLMPDLRSTTTTAMKPLLILSILIALSEASLAQGKDGEANPTKQVFREPFTLKLHLDEENYYEEKFKKIPYVHEGDVYLFSGESFGVSLTIKEGKVSGASYAKAPEKADLTFKFSQEIEKDRKSAMMMLVIKNNTKKKVLFDALMTIPGKKGIFDTSILPLDPGLTNFESWPHPIVQLVLRKIRFDEGDEEPATEPKTELDGDDQSPTRSAIDP